MRVLVTRPQPDADMTAERLREIGHTPLVAPLIEIQGLNQAGSLDISGFQAVLVTSANGARALARATDCRDTQIFAVGAASAETARQAGFKSVESADGDVGALKLLVMECLDPGVGHLLHITGSVTAGNLAGELRCAGFSVNANQLYQADTVSTLPTKILDGITQHRIDAMIFFSPRTSRTFMQLVRKAKILELLNNINVFCLSEEVRKSLEESYFEDVRVAQRPEQDSLFQLLQMNA